MALKFVVSRYLEIDDKSEDSGFIRSLLPDYLREEAIGYYIYQPLVFEFEMDGKKYSTESSYEAKYYEL